MGVWGGCDSVWGCGCGVTVCGCGGGVTVWVCGGV